MEYGESGCGMRGDCRMRGGCGMVLRRIECLISEAWVMKNNETSRRNETDLKPGEMNLDI